MQEAWNEASSVNNSSHTIRSTGVYSQACAATGRHAHTVLRTVVGSARRKGRGPSLTGHGPSKRDARIAAARLSCALARGPRGPGHDVEERKEQTSRCIEHRQPELRTERCAVLRRIRLSDEHLGFRGRTGACLVPFIYDGDIELRSPDPAPHGPAFQAQK